MYYKAKELDPGKTIRGKIIQSWNVSDTRSLVFGKNMYRIMITFIDGTKEQGVLEQ